MSIINNLIIGAGITGLYLAYKLKDKNTVIVEKNNYIGGRIYTNEYKGYKYESGAGRLGKKQKLVMELVEELGLKDKLFSISKEKSYVFNGEYIKDDIKLFKFYKINRFKNINELWSFIFNSKNQFSQDFLINNTFITYLQTILKSNEVDLLYKSFGYIVEFLQQSAHATLTTLENDFDTKDNDFCVLSGGLNQLVFKLVDKLEEMGIKIIKECELVDFKLKETYNSASLHYKNKKGEIKSKNIKFNKIYFTIPPHNLSKIPYFCDDELLKNAVSGYPLIRIYAKFNPNKDGDVWFKGMNKMVVDNLIKYIIPIDEKSGLIMISYSDGYISEFWNSLKSKKTIIKYLMKYLTELFPNKNIPEPEWITSHFWRYGCTYWKPGFSYEELFKHIKKIYHTKHIYILGEGYSKHPAWVNGSLETVHELL